MIISLDMMVFRNSSFIINDFPLFISLSHTDFKFSPQHYYYISAFPSKWSVTQTFCSFKMMLPVSQSSS